MAIRLVTRSFIADRLNYLRPVGMSLLGTPVIDNLIFPAGKYKTLQGEIIEYEKLVIDNALLTVNRTKNIVESNINGRNGTIKEFINADDFTISMSGSFTSVFGSIPIEMFQKFALIEQSPEALKVESKFLNTLFNIDKVVLTSFSCIQRGSLNDFDVNIEMKADDDFNYTDLLPKESSTVSRPVEQRKFEV